MSSPGAACASTLHPITLITMVDTSGRSLAQVSGFSGSSCGYQVVRTAND